VSRLYPLELHTAKDDVVPTEDGEFQAEDVSVPVDGTSSPPEQGPAVDETATYEHVDDAQPADEAVPVEEHQPVAAQQPEAEPTGTIRKTIAVDTALSLLVSLLLFSTFCQAAGIRGPSPPSGRNICRDCRIDCTEKGVQLRLSLPATKAEICCQGLSCFSESGTTLINLELPFELTAEPYFCDARFWAGPTLLSPPAHVHCPAAKECPDRCWWCWDHLKQPKCISTEEWLLALLTLLLVGWLLQKAKTAIAGLVWIFSLMWSLSPAAVPIAPGAGLAPLESSTASRSSIVHSQSLHSSVAGSTQWQC